MISIYKQQKKIFQAINDNEDVDIIVAFGAISNVVITNAESHKKAYHFILELLPQSSIKLIVKNKHQE